MTPRFYRASQVVERTGLGRSTIYRRISEGRFPKPMRLDGSTSSVWIADEVDAWVYGQIRKARPEFAPGAESVALA